MKSFDSLFFVPPGKIVCMMNSPYGVERYTVSDFNWLKTPPTTSITPGARSTVSRLKRLCLLGPHGTRVDFIILILMIFFEKILMEKLNITLLDQRVDTQDLLLSSRTRNH